MLFIKKMKQLMTEQLEIIGPYFKEGSDYYKPIRVGKFYNNNYIEYKSCQI